MENIASNYSDDFYEENQDHLEKRRQLLNAKRLELESEQNHKDHWMKCPKCSEQMVEIELLSIVIEKCEGCGGLYFDKGELETLLDITDRRGFFNTLKNTMYN